MIIVDKDYALEKAENQYYLGYIDEYTKNTIIKFLNSLPSAQQESCEDAVSRADMLECFADLYDVFEDSYGVINELNRKFDDLRNLPSVRPNVIQCEQCKHYE